MTTLTIKIPDAETQAVSKYIANVGGEIVKSKKVISDKDDEVTHEQYFGENIRRAIKAFSK